MSATGSNGGSHAGHATGRQPATPADKLAQLVARHGLSKEVVAKQLGWDQEQLESYLAPEKGQPTVHAAPEIENAVTKLLVRYEIAQAASVAKRSAMTLHAPASLAMRRAHAIPQLARYMTDRRSVFQPVSSTAGAVTNDNALASPGDSTTSQFASNRKRKRTPTVKALTDFKTPPRLKPSTDLLCPIRIDVDAEGVRYQDTLLINASAPGSSPDEIAARIASDERLNTILRDAIAESIKRQLMAFASFVEDSAESLHPIHLDLVIDGLALRDQFEWDIYSDLNNAESFAATMSAEMSLPAAFEPAIAFSIREQVCAYRRILYSKRWIGNDPVAQKAASSAPVPAQPRPLGISTLEPLEKTVVRDPTSTALWQPVLSELGADELQYLNSKIAAQRRSLTTKKPVSIPQSNGSNRTSKKLTPRFHKETKAPRPINPFIMYCQVQKDLFSHPKQKRSAAESRKILGDMWRKCTDEEKEYYAQLTEVENEKRRREHVFEMRDRAISEWEEEEARRIGLLGSSVLDASTEHVRGLLFAGYIDERHEVDSNRPVLADEDDDDNDDSVEGDEAEEE